MSLVHIAQAASTFLQSALVVFAALGEVSFGTGRQTALAYVKA
ncbi:MAG: hypothetical protein QG639_634 [Patescibacteria group bacterium]|nr:hypothetical protein [Patescibacteria group bacterium]